MPVNQQDVGKIIAAAPGFQGSWNEFLEDWKAESPLPWYVAMSELALCIVDNYAHGLTNEFLEFFATLESLLDDSDPDVHDGLGGPALSAAHVALDPCRLDV